MRDLANPHPAANACQMVGSCFAKIPLAIQETISKETYVGYSQDADEPFPEEPPQVHGIEYASCILFLRPHPSGYECSSSVDKDLISSLSPPPPPTQNDISCSTYTTHQLPPNSQLAFRILQLLRSFFCFFFFSSFRISKTLRNLHFVPWESNDRVIDILNVNFRTTKTSLPP